MNGELHLPWDKDSLKTILREAIARGEATKIDQKSLYDLSNRSNKAEFLKDVSAFANTHWPYYFNYGFIIFGARDNKIIYTEFPDTEDHIQASINEIINNYISPFIETYFWIFNDDGKQWGVLIIPPTRNAPHMFIKDICNRYSGDIYVRNGTTTGKAKPEDFPRFFRFHLEEFSSELKQSIADLQRQIMQINEKIKDKKPKTEPQISTQHEQSKIGKNKIELKQDSISEIVKEIIDKEEDLITKGLFSEVRKIDKFIESEEIPWAISNIDREQSGRILSKIESVSNELWVAMTNLIIKDKKGVYYDTIVKIVSYMSRVIQPPSGVSFNESCKCIRYYPLYVLLVLISIICVAERKDTLLRRIFKLQLSNKTSPYDEPLPIAYVSLLIRYSEWMFDPMHSEYPNTRWCDPVASYTELLIKRIINQDDILWDKENEYFVGEFVLSLAPMDYLDKNTNKPLIEYPTQGLYMLYSTAIPIIARFLKGECEWLRNIYERPLEELLTEFDQKAKKIRIRNCFNVGFTYGAMNAAFPEKKDLKE